MQRTNMVKNLIARILAAALLCAGASPALSQLVRPQNGGTGIANNVAATLTRSGSFGLTITTSATAAMTISNTANQVYFNTAASTIGTSANFLFDNSAVRLTVGTGSGTSAGIVAGYEGTNSGYSAIWSTGTTASNTNYNIRFLGGSPGWSTAINAGTGGQIDLLINNSAKFSQVGTAGAGPSITAGTATTDVAALSITRTNNNAAVATGVKFAFTDTTSAAGFLPFQVLGGASATTNLFSVDKSGNIAVGLGTVGAPSIYFTGTTNTGFSAANASTIDASAAGAQIFRIFSTGIRFGARTLGFESGGSFSSNTVAFTGIASNVLALGNGGAGDFSGTLKLATLQGGTTLTLDNAASGSLTIGANAVTPASSGVRFLCIDTAGVITSATTCVGT